MDERERLFRNRQYETHARSDDAAPGRLSAAGLLIAIGVVAVIAVTVVILLLR